ncbi:phage tail protein [Burkholderia gladioli]|uniref:glycine-rich domain-containing protein n=1 Tax=Burkholderia gladioli TaxID=28095 RepID=UPI001640E8BA|nr:phage tail protein [Burkholderia gladioli]
MAASNDFLVFAGGAGANVLSQADYAQLAAISVGFQSGVAQSAALNKAWRQSSIMASVLAQFIVAQTGQSAVDDGTTATLLANLLAAIQATAQQIAPRAQTFLALGNFTTPPGITTIYRTGCAGGGGGAGSPNIPANNIVAGGAGGAAGQFWIRSPMAVTPGQVIPIVIGAGGVAGAVGGAGGNGSNTSVGSDVLAAGAGGQVGTSGAPTQAWPGQPGGNGFPNGDYGQDTSQYGPGATGGRGAGGPFGASGAPGRGAIGGVASLLPPSASFGFGVGGSGAGGSYGPTTASGTTAGTVGAAGMPGFMLIEW